MFAFTRFFLCLLICTSLKAFTQTDTSTISLIKVIRTEQIKQIFNIPTQGIFVANIENILQYHYNGDMIAKHVLESSYSDFTIDASNTFHVLIYDKDATRATFADRWLRTISEIKLDAAYKLVCMARTGDLWLYNSFDHSMIKYNPNLQQTLAEISLLSHFTRNEGVLSIKEFGHFITLRTNKHLYFFSTFGELVSKIELAEHALTYFDQQNLWILKGKLLQKSNLYNKESSPHRIELPKDDGIKHLIVAENEKTLILSSGDKLYFYELPTLIEH